MSGIDPGRVAEVLVTLRGARPGRRGSGYRVSGSAVLTAAHVVRGAARVRVRFDADQPGEWIADAKVAWADDGVDAAVLTLAGEAGGDAVPEAGFGRVAAADAVLTCSAVGFPRFKLRADPAGPGDDSPSQYRDSVHATGTIAVLSNRREGTLEVIVAAPERDDDPARSPWEGMSGAAVWSAGQIIGVITEHHRSDGLGRLAASRVDRWYTKLNSKHGGALRRVLPFLPVTPGELTEVVPATEAERLQAGYLAQVRDIAPAELIGRDTELARLVKFCAGPDPYAWWQAGPWAGKSALAAWFVLHPPAGTVIASFFVTSRLTGQADSDAFTEAMIEQLAAIAGEPVTGAATPAGRDRERRRLLEAAAARVAARQQRLVLVIDGLDEDVGPAASGLPSIASLLPRNPHDAVRILVTSRPHPGLPSDVPDGHPLRQCERYELAPSSLARDIQHEARNELLHRLRGDRLQVDVIGFITAAGGGLTLSELAELTGERYWNLKGKLGSVFGRSLLTRQSYDPPAEDPEDRVYLFAHETLRVIAEHELAHDLGPYRERLYAWADGYRAQGWPESTPRYLLRPYGRMLAATRDLSRLAGVATDTARQDRMMARSFGDASATAEIAAARQLVLSQSDQDLAALAVLAISQDRLDSRNESVPKSLIALWAHLGQVSRAEALAHSFHDLDDQAAALSSIAAELASADPDRATALMAEAEQTAKLLPDPVWRSIALGSLAEDMARAGFWDAARRVVQSLDTPWPRLDGLCALVRVAGLPPGLRAALIRDAVSTSQDVMGRQDKNLAVVEVVEALVAAGLWDSGEEVAGLVGSSGRQMALSSLVDGLLEAGRWEQAGRIAGGIASEVVRAQTLASIAAAIVGDDDLAMAMAGEAERLIRPHLDAADSGPDFHRTLATVAVVISRLNHQRAVTLAAEIEARVRHSDGTDRRARGLPLASLAWTVADRAHAQDLADEAVRLALDLQEPEASSGARRSAASGLAKAGFWEHASRVAMSIPDSWQQSLALSELAAELIRAGLLDQASQVTLAIADQERRTEAIRLLVERLVLAGRWGQAVQLASAQPDRDDRGREFGTIVDGLSRAGLIRESEQTARSADTTSYRTAQMLASAGQAVAAADRQHALSLAAEAEQIARTPLVSLDQVCATAAAAGALTILDPPAAIPLAAVAEQAARGLPDTQDLARALAANAAAVASLDPAKAKELATEAVDIARGLTYGRGTVLRSAVLDLLDAGLWDEASEAARAVREPRGRAALLATTAVIRARRDHEAAVQCADEAVRTALTISDTSAEASTLRLIARRLAKAGLGKQAEQAANAIVHPGDRAKALPVAAVLAVRDTASRERALPGLAAALANAVQQQTAGTAFDSRLIQEMSAVGEMFAMAEAEPARAAAAAQAAESVRSPRERCLAMSAAAVLLGAADPGRSRALADQVLLASAHIPDESGLSIVLSVSATALAAAGQWEHALRAASSLSGEEQAEAIRDITTGLVRAQMWDHAISAIQLIDELNLRPAAARDLAVDLAANRYWDQAEDAADISPDPDDRAVAYVAVLAELASAAMSDAAAGCRDGPGASSQRRNQGRRLAAAVLSSRHWPYAIKPLGVLSPPDAMAIGGLLLRAPGG